MQANTVIRHYFTADLYDRILTSSEFGTEEVEYALVGSINLTIVNSANAGLRAFTAAPLAIDARLRNVRDRYGTPLYPTDDPGGQVFHVKETKAVVDPLSIASGFESALKRIS